MMVADDIKDTLIAQANRIILMDSLQLASLRLQVATLLRNEARWSQLSGNKDEQLNMYADNEKELRKQLRRQKVSKFFGYLLAAGIGVLTLIK